MLGMFMGWLCTPKHTLALTLRYPIHYDFRQPFRPAGTRYQLLLYLCLPFYFDNNSLLGVPKSTKLPHYNRGEGSDDDRYYSGEGLRLIAALVE
jgi:hypothetical protein